MENKSYFEKVTKEYKKASEYSEELYQNMAIRLNKILFGRVVDFGNGGIINYDTQKIEKLICVDIINKNRNITNKKINFIYGDFYSPDLNSNADCILAQFLLHHLTDDKKLRISIRKVKTKLNERGKLVIGEIVVPRSVELIQNIMKPIIFPILALMKKPGLRFFSAQSLSALLADAGFNDIQIQNIPIGKKVSPAPVLFPGLRMPGKLYPFKCILIEAKTNELLGQTH